jgi:hypothetical protein
VQESDPSLCSHDIRRGRQDDKRPMAQLRRGIAGGLCVG